MRNDEAFFRDDFRLGLLDLQERLDPALKLDIEHPLLVRPPIFLSEIDSCSRHGENHEHHREEQLRAEAERSRKTVLGDNSLVTWLENRHAKSCRFSIPRDAAGRRRRPPKLSARSYREEDVPDGSGRRCLFFENRGFPERG